MNARTTRSQGKIANEGRRKENLPGIMEAWRSLLFMTERLNRIESGRFDRGEHAEGEPDQRAKTKRQRDRPGGDVRVLQVERKQSRHQCRQPLRKDQPEKPTHRAQENRLDEKLKQDRARACADGFS